MPRMHDSLGIEPNGHRLSPVWHEYAVSFLTAWLLAQVGYSVWLAGALWGKGLPFLFLFCMENKYHGMHYGFRCWCTASWLIRRLQSQDSAHSDFFCTDVVCTTTWKFSLIRNQARFPVDRIPISLFELLPACQFLRPRSVAVCSPKFSDGNTLWACTSLLTIAPVILFILTVGMSYGEQ